ncbi:hypothetical protein CLS_00290 [[Clostridium] cf. saccharolyticum K10]|nr:hypothetical protein CLS_00290 [[Clostridium] cf. saccharolyticum K10]
MKNGSPRFLAGCRFLIDSAEIFCSGSSAVQQD